MRRAIQATALSKLRLRRIPKRPVETATALDKNGNPLPQFNPKKFVRRLSSLSSREADDAQALEELEAEIDLEMEIGIALTIVYYVRQAFDSENDRIAWAKAVGWVFLAVTVAFLEIVMMLSLVLTSNWPGCESRSDCVVGLECTQSLDADLWQQPKCLDCYFLVAGGGRPGEPWGFPLVGSLPESEFTGQLTNATIPCHDTLYNNEYVHLFNPDGSYFRTNETQYSFHSCMYAHATGMRMSLLDRVILQVSFCILAFQVTLDAKEQDIANYMRRRLIPITIPDFTSPSSVGKFCLLSVIKFTDIMYRRMSPCLLPAALCMLLVAVGASSSSIILNGLSVGFVYEMDNMIAKMLLSNQEEAAIGNYFVKAAARFALKDSRDKAKRRHGLDTKSVEHIAGISTRAEQAAETAAQKDGKIPLDKVRMTSHPFELQARFMMSFIACNFGFFKITNHGSNIPCEMLAYYLYYRISCMFGIWVHLGVQEGCWLGIKLVSWIRRNFARLLRQAAHGELEEEEILADFETLADFLLYIAQGFCEALCAAVTLHSIFAIECFLFWKTDMNFAMENYMTGFVQDIFGTCAASGYKEAFGYDCL